MDVEEYKRRISAGDVLDHTTLNVTLKEVVARQQYELAAALQQVLQHNRIEKPEGEASLTSVSYYQVDLSPVQVEAIIDMFNDLEEQHLGAGGENTPTAAFYSSLGDKWSNLT